jgi:hypothetical protein
MFRHKFYLYTFGFLLISSSSYAEQKCSADDAIRRVDNCECFRSAEGQQLEPWKLSWDDEKKLRSQFSHCICTAHIDLKSVRNPKRYVVPGSAVK